MWFDEWGEERETSVRLTSLGGPEPCEDWLAGTCRWVGRSQPDTWTSPTEWRDPVTKHRTVEVQGRKDKERSLKFIKHHRWPLLDQASSLLPMLHKWAGPLKWDYRGDTGESNMTKQGIRGEWREVKERTAIYTLSPWMQGSFWPAPDPIMGR